eukprot:UN31240
MVKTIQTRVNSDKFQFQVVLKVIPMFQAKLILKDFKIPLFCENTDKALYTGTITIPSDLPLQHYTLQWYWAFNSPTDLYATCWEAELIASTGGGDEDITTAPPVNPGCTECCISGPVQAPGTGDMVIYPNILDGESVFLTCPEGFDR